MRKAFSIAEALITLAIVGIAMGSMAPLISKAMKGSGIEAASKWFFTQNAANISRPAGNVGVGVGLNINPLARLHVKGAAGQDILKVQTSGGGNAFNVNQSGVTTFSEPVTVQKANATTDIFNVKNENGTPFSVYKDGIVSVRSMNDDGHTKFRFIDNTGTIRASIDNRGQFVIKPSYPWTGFSVKNINNDNTYVTYANAAGEESYVYHNMGFAVLGNGGVRINYEEVPENENAGGPMVVYVDGGRRFSMNEAGQTVISFAIDDARGTDSLTSAFLVRSCDNNCGPDATYTSLFQVQRTGYTIVGGDLNVTGDIKHNGSSILSMIDTKFAEINEELNNTKELVAQLKEQNELLKQQVAILEANQKQPFAGEFNKIVNSKDSVNNFLSKLSLK